MRSPWYLVVRGTEADLARLRQVSEQSPDVELDQETPDEWRLRSATVNADGTAEGARSDLLELLVRLSDVAAAVAYGRVQVAPGALGRSGEDGTSGVWVFPEPARARLRAFPPTVIVGGVAPEPLESKLMRLAASNEHLRLALHFLNADMSWFNLWKSYEAIWDANGGKPGLVTNGWTTNDELRRFSKTANTYAMPHATPGSGSRHHRTL